MRPSSLLLGCVCAGATWAASAASPCAGEEGRDNTVTPQSLERALAEIGALQARVRGAHLEAHLAQAAILTPAQNARHAELRGYRAGAPSPHGGPHQH